MPLLFLSLAGDKALVVAEGDKGSEVVDEVVIEEGEVKEVEVEEVVDVEEGIRGHRKQQKN